MRNPVGLCACITLLGAGSSALRLKLVNSSYDVDLLREVGFLRSRHEEATNLLTKSLKKRGTCKTVLNFNLTQRMSVEASIF